MMSVVKQGRLNLCSHLLGGWYANLALCLYVNDYTPDADTTLADLTEGAWTGYAPVSLTGFSEANLNGMDRAYTTAATCTFTNSSGADVTCYGQFLKSPGPQLYCVERFATPVVIPDGGSVDFDVKLTDTTEA